MILGMSGGLILTYPSDASDSCTIARAGSQANIPLFLCTIQQPTRDIHYKSSHRFSSSPTFKVSRRCAEVLIYDEYILDSQAFHTPFYSILEYQFS